MPIPVAVPGPATGKTRASSLRDWSEDEDDDCQILEVYDPRPFVFSYPVPSPPADSDIQVLEVEPLAVGGANCGRGEQTDAMGRLEFGGRWTLEVPGRDGACRYAHEVKHTMIYPSSGPS